MVKSKSTYIIMIISALIIAIQAFSIAYLLKDMNDNMEKAMKEYGITAEGEIDYGEEKTEIYIGSTGFSNEVDMLVKGEAPFDQLLLSSLKSMNLFLMLAIFAVVFCNADRKNGFIKNLAGSLPRWKIVLSKFICIVIYAAAAFVVSAAVSLIVSKLVLEVKFDVMDVVVGNVGNIFKVLGFELLGHIAIMTIILAIVSATGSTAASMSLGIVFGSGFPSVFYQLGTMLLQKYTSVPEDFYIGDYVPSGIVQCYTPGLSSGDTARMLVVGFAYTIIFLAFSMFIISKKDIK